MTLSKLVFDPLSQARHARGANVVLLAKTAEPHPKLPGTVHAAAAEIEEAGIAFDCLWAETTSTAPC